MATARPFAYNPSQTPISGATQIGDLAIGYPSVGFTNSGLQWWNGPDEELGYVIARTSSNHPTPLFSGAPSGHLTLSSTYKGNSMNLSNGNQTVHQFFGYVQTVLGETLINGNDKVMFSISCLLDAPGTFPNGHFLGFGKTSMNYNGVVPDPYNSFPGNDNKSIGFNSGGEYWYNGFTQSSGLPTWTTGDVIDVAVDLLNDSIWIRVNGGYWNNDSGANPSTNTGYRSTYGLTSFYPALCPAYEGTYTIQNTTSYGVPSGFTLLGTNINASVGFLRSSALTEISFVNLVNSKFSQSFSNGSDSKDWLNNNGYWTSYTGSLVVTTGLVLNLDANNSSSYSGTGTTWYDISGNSNNVDMQNSGSITWIDGGIGYFTTGSNGWFSKTNGTNMPTGSGLYTFSAWIQLGASWNGQGIMSVGPFGSGNEANAFRTGSTNQLINYWWGNDLVVQDNSVSPTNWFNVVVKYDGITRSIWVNGVLVGSDTPVGHNVTTSDIQVAKTVGSEYLQGNIAQVLIYNTALSNSEILANFNATKSRFGY